MEYYGEVFDVDAVGTDGVSSLSGIIHRSRFEPKIALIHLSSTHHQPNDYFFNYCGEVFSQLPQLMRRVFFCDGSTSPIDAVNTGVHLHGDMIANIHSLESSSYQARALNMISPFEQIISRGLITLQELNERGKTIEVNNRREGQRMRPEREGYLRYFPYSDDYYRRK